MTKGAEYILQSTWKYIFKIMIDYLYSSSLHENLSSCVLNCCTFLWCWLQYHRAAWLSVVKLILNATLLSDNSCALLLCDRKLLSDVKISKLLFWLIEQFRRTSPNSHECSCSAAWLAGTDANILQFVQWVDKLWMGHFSILNRVIHFWEELRCMVFR